MGILCLVSPPLSRVGRKEPPTCPGASGLLFMRMAVSSLTRDAGNMGPGNQKCQVGRAPLPTVAWGGGFEQKVPHRLTWNWLQAMHV